LDGSRYMTLCPLCGAFMHPADIDMERISIITQQDLCINTLWSQYLAPVPS
jgi:hypothetical protein